MLVNEGLVLRGRLTAHVPDYAQLDRAGQIADMQMKVMRAFMRPCIQAPAEGNAFQNVPAHFDEMPHVEPAPVQALFWMNQERTIQPAEWPFIGSMGCKMTDEADVLAPDQQPIRRLLGRKAEHLLRAERQGHLMRG